MSRNDDRQRWPLVISIEKILHRLHDRDWQLAEILQEHRLLKREMVRVTDFENQLMHGTGGIAAHGILGCLHPNPLRQLRYQDSRPLPLTPKSPNGWSSHV